MDNQHQSSNENQRPNLNLDLTVGQYREPQSGITVEKIREMVELFYTRTQQDAMLGPIFSARVQDWDAHYEKMTRFWSSAAIRAGTYSGRPIEAHQFGGLTKAHFGRWVELFTRTANDVFNERDAGVFVNLGQKMASSIAMRIGTGRISFA